MKKRFLLFALLAAALCFYGCETSLDDTQDDSSTVPPDEEQESNNGEDVEDEVVELPELPDLEDVDDVCTKMTDLDFMRYCYENFDVNGDAKVSMYEANAVKTISCSTAADFTGIEYFPNLESFESTSAKYLDLRYNAQLADIMCEGAPIEELDLRYCESLTSIGANAFKSCKELASIEFPSCLESIGEYAFSNCDALSSVVLPSGLASIGDYAFYECTGLTSVKFSSGLASIGKYAFYGCTGLTSIELPSRVTAINGCAFYGCTSLTSIGLSTGLKSIGSDAFRGCSELTSIDFPDSLTSIGSNAFNGCKKLKTVTSRAVIPPSAHTSQSASSFDAFYGCSFVLYVPEESLSEYESSSGWCEYATSIEAISE